MGSPARLLIAASLLILLGFSRTDIAAFSFLHHSPTTRGANSRRGPLRFVQAQEEDSHGRCTVSALYQSAGSANVMSQQMWFQHSITVTAPSRGCHLITGDILKAAGTDIARYSIGMCNIFIQHTSASLTINENADSDVRVDMETALNKLVPAQWNRDGTFRHTMEGDDDMPGHVKSSLMGVSLNIPIRNGKLALGTWQGIYLNEHRDQGGWGGGHARNIVITLQGQGK
jgi:secondary thiamine-phosphate synthase enzyme